MSPLVKLVWLRQEYPRVFSQAARFIGIKEYLCWHWCQAYLIDHALAAATGLLNIGAFAAGAKGPSPLHWEPLALEVAMIREEHLSELVTTTHICPPINPQEAAKLGIAPQTPLVIGASDGVLASLGLGAVKPGDIAVTIGTSAAVRSVGEGPSTAKATTIPSLFSYPLTEKYWIIGGAVNNGGLTLQWLKENLLKTNANYQQLTAMAAEVPVGAGGLLFYPYLTGERAPLWNPEARGMFWGLSWHHQQSHLARAVLEGVIFNLYLVFKVLEKRQELGNTIHAGGGFTQSSLWLQILADVFDKEVRVYNQRESSCWGAAFLGLYALGFFTDLNPCTERSRSKSSQGEGAIATTEQTSYHPLPANLVKYEKILPFYERMLSKLASEYKSWAQLQADLQ